MNINHISLYLFKHMLLLDHFGLPVLIIFHSLSSNVFHLSLIYMCLGYRLFSSTYSTLLNDKDDNGRKKSVWILYYLC